MFIHLIPHPTPLIGVNGPTITKAILLEVYSKPTLGLKLTILLSLTIMHGFPSLKPKVSSTSPEQLPSQDLWKRQAFLFPPSSSTFPRSLYGWGVSAHGKEKTHKTFFSKHFLTWIILKLTDITFSYANLLVNGSRIIWVTNLDWRLLHTHQGSARVWQSLIDDWLILASTVFKILLISLMNVIILLKEFLHTSDVLLIWYFIRLFERNFRFFWAWGVWKTCKTECYFCKILQNKGCID